MKGRLQDFRHSKPTTAQFIIEVAIHSLALDRAKAREYGNAGVPEVWIVQPEGRVIEVYRNPVTGVYSQVLEIPADALLESSSLPGFSFRLADALAE